MFRLIAMVRRGTACDLPEGWAQYSSMEAARAGAAALLRHERVQRVMIVRDGLRPSFVEWCNR